MDEELKKKFKKYIYPRKFLTIFFGILSAGLLAYWFYALIDVRNHPGLFDTCIYVFIALAVCSAITVYDVIRRKKVAEKIDEFEKQGTLHVILHDFETAGTAFKDSLRLGQNYLFGKETGNIFTYNDIVQMYQYIHKTNLIEDTRILKVKTSAGKTLDLCKLPLRGKGDDELSQVFAYVKGKNENIYIGYH